MTVTIRRVVARVTAVTIAATVVALLAATPASAHSDLERSDPPHGGMVPEGRTTISLWFTEPVRLEASMFELYSLGDQQVTVITSASDAAGQGFVGNGDPVAITVTSSASDEGFVEITFAPLPEAIYQLDYTALSAVDGHPARGVLVFGAGVRPQVLPAGEEELPTASEYTLRMIELSAVILAIGAMAVAGRVLGSMGLSGGAARRRALFIGALAAVVALIVGAMTPFAREPHAGASFGAWFDATSATLTSTSWGRLWLVREAGLVVVAAALWWRVIRRDGGSRAARIGVVAMSAVVWFGAWAGHAAVLPRSPSIAAMASALHLGAAGVWAGGLAVLVACLLPAMRRDPDARGPIVASAWRAFSPMAAVATIVLVATGLYETGRHIPEVGAVTSTVYGEVVGLKLGLIVAALIVAGFNTLLVNPQLAAPIGRMLGRPLGWSPVSLRRFTTLVGAEVALLIVAVAGAALLTSVVTPRELERSAQETAPRSVNVGGLFMTFEEVPLGDGESRLIVRTRSVVKPEPAPISGVDVQLAHATGSLSDVPLNTIEEGRYEAGIDRLTPGAWQVTVAVHRSGLPDLVTQVDWEVAADAPAGARPLEVATSGIAALLLIALGATVALVRRRTGPPADAAPRVDEYASVS